MLLSIARARRHAFFVLLARIFFRKHQLFAAETQCTPLYIAHHPTEIQSRRRQY